MENTLRTSRAIEYLGCFPKPKQQLTPSLMLNLPLEEAGALGATSLPKRRAEHAPVAFAQDPSSSIATCLYSRSTPFARP